MRFSKPSNRKSNGIHRIPELIAEIVDSHNYREVIQIYDVEKLKTQSRRELRGDSRLEEVLKPDFYASGEAVNIWRRQRPALTCG